MMRMEIQESYYGFPVTRLGPGRYTMDSGGVLIRRISSRSWAIDGLDGQEGWRYLSASAALSAAAYELHKEA